MTYVCHRKGGYETVSMFGVGRSLKWPTERVGSRGWEVRCLFVRLEAGCLFVPFVPSVRPLSSHNAAIHGVTMNELSGGNWVVAS